MRRLLCAVGLHKWRITQWITYGGRTKRKTVACQRPFCTASREKVNRRLA